MTEKRI